ncbi:hypothetical protein GCM10009759_31010 [Kitasatospora saccharophila]|uniref:Uncharacterized protein n=1 Tax=Kitasatospora saccharophila TaxID=407973 RepID=A0ABP5IER7_9ACTN
MAAAGVPDLEAVPAEHRDQGGGHAVVVLDQEQAHRVPFPAVFVRVRFGVFVRVRSGGAADRFGHVRSFRGAGRPAAAAPAPSRRNGAILASMPIRRHPVNRDGRSVTQPVSATRRLPGVAEP